MATHAPPSDEIDRVAALSRYRILDTPPDIAFDDLAHLAAALCRAPIAVITFIDQDRQWFKAKIGLTMTQTVRSSGLCAQAVQHKTLIAIEDARADPRFSSHPLVREDPRVRFYCGAPILNPDGHAVGTIAVMDAAPRVPTEEQCQALRRLARQAAAQLELRRLTFDRSSLDAQSLEEIMAGMADAVFVTDRSGRVLGANHEAEVLFGRTSSDLTGRLLHDCVHRHERGAAQGSGELCGLVSAAALRGRTESPNDVFVRNNGSTVQVSWIAAPLIRRGEWVGGLVSVRDLTAQKRNEEALGVLAGTTRATGVAFLRELVDTLARSIGGGIRVLYSPPAGAGARDQAVAGSWAGWAAGHRWSMTLAGTPCEHVLREGFCHYPGAVQAAFPQDELLRQLSIESYMALTLPSPTGEAIGWIAVLARAPLKDRRVRTESLLRMAAGRAGSELGRPSRRTAASGRVRSGMPWRCVSAPATVSGMWNRRPARPDRGGAFRRLCASPSGVRRMNAGARLTSFVSTGSRTRTTWAHESGTESGTMVEGTADGDVFDVQRRVRQQGRRAIVWAQVGRAQVAAGCHWARTPIRMVDGATTDITERKRDRGGAAAGEVHRSITRRRRFTGSGPARSCWMSNDAACDGDAGVFAGDEFRGMTVHDLNPAFPGREVAGLLAGCAGRRGRDVVRGAVTGPRTAGSFRSKSM
jgi:PAS domain S-box-containing protein